MTYSKIVNLLALSTMCTSMTPKVHAETPEDTPSILVDKTITRPYIMDDTIDKDNSLIDDNLDNIDDIDNGTVPLPEIINDDTQNDKPLPISNTVNFWSANGTVNTKQNTGNYGDVGFVDYVYSADPFSDTPINKDLIDNDNSLVEKVQAKGIFGENRDKGIKWYITMDGTLMLSSGELYKSYYSGKSPWYHQADLVNRVVLTDKIIGTDNISYAFFQINAESFENLENLDLSQTTDMSYMFAQNKKIKSIDINILDTSNIRSLKGLFDRSSLLSNINIDNINTQNVEDIDTIFAGTAVKHLNLNKWNTTNMKIISHAFLDTSLETLEINDWNTDNVTEMAQTFSIMKNIKEINVSKWKLPNLENAFQAFMGSNTVEKINMQNWTITDKFYDLSFMFVGLSNLKYLNLANMVKSDINVSLPYAFSMLDYTQTVSGYDFADMFPGYNIHLDISQWDLRNTTQEMYEGLLYPLNVERLDIQNTMFAPDTTMDILYQYTQYADPFGKFTPDKIQEWLDTANTVGFDYFADLRDISKKYLNRPADLINDINNGIVSHDYYSNTSIIDENYIAEGYRQGKAYTGLYNLNYHLKYKDYPKILNLGTQQYPQAFFPDYRWLEQGSGTIDNPTGENYVNFENTQTPNAGLYIREKNTLITIVDEIDKGLKGVLIEIVDHKGNVVYKGYTDDNGSISIELTRGREYTVRQAEAFVGHENLSEQQFTVAKNGRFKYSMQSIFEGDLPITGSQSKIYILVSLLSIFIVFSGVFLYKNNKELKK